MKKVVKYLISLILAIIIVLFVQTFVIVGHVIPNNDMSPTLNKGDRVIVNKIKVTFNQLNNGDIITYRRGNEIYTSRIIAKPGQSMRFVRDNYTVMTDRLTHLMPRTEKLKILVCAILKN
ncbi:Signal peptidase I [Staphylococcus aureus]|nr:Signal peptidase I [Staphylococcus aureus]